ncbi:MAG: S41 family peptidase [Mariprofundaceae bacterium]
MVINNSIYERYQYTKLSCFQAPVGHLPVVGSINGNKLNDWADIKLMDEQTLWIKRPQDDHPVTFTKVSNLPSRCSTPLVSTSVTDFEIIWHTFNENYAAFKARNIDWDALYSKYSARALENDLKLFPSKKEEDIDFYNIITDLLQQLNDGHVFIHASNIGKMFFADSYDTKIIIDRYRDQRIFKKLSYILKYNYLKENELRAFANKKILYGELPNNIAYLNFLELANFSSADMYEKKSERSLRNSLKRIKSLLKNKQAVIIDLRFNPGGSVRFANIISSYFSKKAMVTSYIQAKRNPLHGNGFTPQHVAGFNLDKMSKDKELKVYILTSKYTASAAEHLIINLKAAGAIQLGQTTRGVFSPVLVRSLKRNWYFGLSNQKLTTHNDRSPEGFGISPDTLIDQNLLELIQSEKDQAIEIVLKKYSIHSRKP